MNEFFFFQHYVIYWHFEWNEYDMHVLNYDEPTHFHIILVINFHLDWTNSDEVIEKVQKNQS